MWKNESESLKDTSKHNNLSKLKTEVEEDISYKVRFALYINVLPSFVATQIAKALFAITHVWERTLRQDIEGPLRWIAHPSIPHRGAIGGPPVVGTMRVRSHGAPNDTRTCWRQS